MAEVAVVIPFRGEWTHVLPTLRALNQQTIRPSLAIVLSIDGFEKAPLEIAQLTDVCLNGIQGGPAIARNRGWLGVEAPFILFTDSDCIPETDWAEKMLNKLKGECQAVKGVYSAGGTKIIQRLAQVEFEERYYLMKRAETIYLADTYSAGYRRSSLQKTGGFDEGFPFPEHEDVDLSWRLVESGGRICFIPDARVGHKHRSSWTTYFRMKLRRGKWRMMLVKKFPARAISDGYTPQMLKLQILLSIPLLLSLFLIFQFPLITLLLSSVFTILCIPLTITAFKTDPKLAILVPPFALWRGIALFSGSLQGLFGKVD